jgi:hypothetical protein
VSIATIIFSFIVGTSLFYTVIFWLWYTVTIRVPKHRTDIFLVCGVILIWVSIGLPNLFLFYLHRWG